MGYEVVVCVKQVPDTENLTGEAMKEDGTVNRTALPTIFNPEDLNALEMALQIRDAHGGRVTVITMGPPRAVDVMREALFRGADAVVLLTDRRFAAGDTLATSYTLACAIRKLPTPDLVLCGRQAIDGDTAQTGPQLAEKLALPQFTYVDEIRDITPGSITVKRGLEGGYEVLRGPLPALLTVTSSANDPRPPSAKRLMKHKKARAPLELGDDANPEAIAKLRSQGLLIEQWSMEDVGCDESTCGANGSPTQVKKVDSVQLVSEEHRRIEPTTEGLTALVVELVEEHIFD
ncbi:MAG: electron transfer flavoprotein subunit beta/FixA family protein [Planctomycetota bacterium]